MKNCLLAIILLLLPLPVSSQKVTIHNQIFKYKNSVNGELGGFAFGSIYYERVLINQRDFKTTGQAGLGLLGIPIVFHEVVSFNKHHIELGLGIVLPIKHLTYSAAEDPFLTARIGYRLQQPGRNFIFRAGLMHVRPGADRKNGPEIILWVFPGLSFGWAF